MQIQGGGVLQLFKRAGAEMLDRAMQIPAVSHVLNTVMDPSFLAETAEQFHINSMSIMDPSRAVPLAVALAGVSLIAAYLRSGGVPGFIPASSAVSAARKLCGPCLRSATWLTRVAANLAGHL